MDHHALIQGLRERAESDTQQPLLRICDVRRAPDRVPQPEHRRLRVMPRVTVRLGALTLQRRPLARRRAWTPRCTPN
ncbi:hypothetical protein SGLAM104S_07448 [Streptomyces glaucescens]